MFNWVHQRRGPKYDRQKKTGAYQFLALIGDFVDGNGGCQDGRAGCADMWAPMYRLTDGAIAQDPTLTIGGTPGNHDFKSLGVAQNGCGEWAHREDAGLFLRDLYKKQSSPPIQVPGTEYPFVTYKRFQQGGMWFLVLFLPMDLPGDMQSALQAFVDTNADALLIVCVHYIETAPYMWNYRNLFLALEGHHPMALQADGTYEVYAYLKKGNSGQDVWVSRADWQEQGPWACQSYVAHFPQHPLFIVYSIEIADDLKSLQVFRAHVQAWNPQNPVYRQPEWNPMRERIALGENDIAHQDQAGETWTFQVSDYVP